MLHLNEPGRQLYQTSHDGNALSWPAGRFHKSSDMAGKLVPPSPIGVLVILEASNMTLVGYKPTK